MSIHVLRVEFKNLFGHSDRFSLLDSVEFVEEHDGDHRIDEVWFHLEELMIGLESIVILVHIVVNVRIANVQLIALSFA